MNKSVKLGWLVVCLLLTAEMAQGQAMFLTDVNGQVIRENKYVEVEGSPYLDEAWQEGSVMTLRNKTYKNLKVRYDAYAGELEYQQNGKNYRLGTRDIRGFDLATPTGDTLRFRNGFPATGGSDVFTFYQVLHDGPTKLLKQPKVVLQEIKQYNQASATRKFAKQDQYFLVAPSGTLTRIQKNRKSLLSALPDRKEALEKLIKEKRLDVGEEAGLVEALKSLDGV